MRASLALNRLLDSFVSRFGGFLEAVGNAESGLFPLQQSGLTMAPLYTYVNLDLRDDVFGVDIAVLDLLSDPGQVFKAVSIDACSIGTSPPGSDFQLDRYDEYERTARSIPGTIAAAVLVVGFREERRYLGIVIKKHMEGWAPTRYDWLPLLQDGLKYGADSLQIREGLGWVCEKPRQGESAREEETQ